MSVFPPLDLKLSLTYNNEDVGRRTETRSVLQIDGGKTVIVQESIPEKKKLEGIATLGVAMELGYSIVLPLVGGVILGVFLDEKWKTSPKLTLSLLFSGLFLGIYNVYRIVREELKEKT